ncbi:patched domain-containing protein 3-like isoform X3 [Acropora muricata]|uniref:patched domain-containing protein 3-like isoform X3 n=1 Tax=Acropora muricata TaxID=159855 RepID=UPI0034E46FFD
MSDHSSPDTQIESRECCSYCKKVSNFITGSLENGFFRACMVESINQRPRINSKAPSDQFQLIQMSAELTRLGKLIGEYPRITIFISLILSGSCLIGLMGFTQENRGDKLWTPENSLALKHKSWVDRNFPTEMRASIVLLVTGDVLTPAILKEALIIHQKIKQIGHGTEMEWEKICFRPGPMCMVNGLLELWLFDETQISSLTKEDILRKINQPTLISPVTNKRFVLTQYIGGIEQNATNHIVKAEAMSILYGIKYNPALSKTEGHSEDNLTEHWETKFNSLMDNFDLSLSKLFYYTDIRYAEDAGDSIQSDLKLLFIGYVLIVIYVAMMLGKFTRLNIKAWLALLGVVCVGLAIGVSFGLSSAFGVFYGPVHSTLPFLLLGTGVDDMFVIVQAWDNIPSDVVKKRGIPEAIGLTLKHAGCSITLTSLTDFLVFMIGATTILPALKSFCIFAGIGILADFALQTTLFTAFLALDARRQDKKLDSCCCCMKLRKGYTESGCGRRDLLQEFMDKLFGKALLSLPGKIVTLVVTAALLGVNLYGTTMLEQFFDHVRFLPPDSMSYRYSVTNSKYFPVDGAPATVYTGNFDYFENQARLHQLYGKLIDNQYVVPSSVSSWYEDYITWAKTHKLAVHFDQGKITNKTLFFSWLKQFLQGPGIIYGKDVRMTNDGTGSHLRITTTRMHLRHKDLDSTQAEVKAMEDLREKIKEVVSDEDMAFAYSSFYLGWETNKIITVELIHNMTYTMIAVFLVTLVVLANLWTCLTVVTCVGFTLVNITGTMYFWSLSVDIVTAIILVLAVGLSVDYASHIGHSFMLISGKRSERAHITIRDMGPAVWNGGFSSFLAVVLLASSSSYVFKTFFKTLTWSNLPATQQRTLDIAQVWLQILIKLKHQTKMMLLPKRMM